MKLTPLSLVLTLALACVPALHADSKSDKKDKKDKDKTEAADTKSDATLSQFKLGELITGPEVKLDEIKGKGVVLEYWGVHCGPCLASLPDMAKLSKRHADTLAFIGAHSQDASDDEVKDVVKKNKLPYTITKGANGPISVTGIPHVFVFDATGKLLFHGMPSDGDFEKAVRNAAKSAKAGAA